MVLLVTGYVCLRAYLTACLLNSEHLYCSEAYISYITSGKEMTYFDLTVHTSISPCSNQEHGRGSKYEGLPRWLSSKQSTCNAGNAGDAGSIPGSGRQPGEGNGNPLQYSCLENSMDRGAWRETESDTTEQLTLCPKRKTVKPTWRGWLHQKQTRRSNWWSKMLSRDQHLRKEEGSGIGWRKKLNQHVVSTKPQPEWGKFCREYYPSALLGTAQLPLPSSVPGSDCFV